MSHHPQDHFDAGSIAFASNADCDRATVLFSQLANALQSEQLKNREAADAIDAQAERIKALDGELLAARAEAALQHNWNCEHDGGCALTDESGYRPQALKYVEDYHALKARIKALEGALRELETEVTKRARFRDNERHPSFVVALTRARALLGEL